MFAGLRNGIIAGHVVPILSYNIYTNFVLLQTVLFLYPKFVYYQVVCSSAGRPSSSEVPRSPLTRWDVSSIPANGIFLTKKL